MENLKLYYLNPNNWGAQWFTIAENKYKALDNILHHAKENFEKYNLGKNFTKEYEYKLIRHMINPAKSKLKNIKYTLDEFENGGVIASEIA